ncbi:MAG: hypothetical protein KC620_06600 [Myxococcales bacterium]|nr:hypothetical protein [Myxococcales bacterium]
MVAAVCRAACADDVDCGSTARCTEAGFCVDLTPCEDATDCPGGQACDCHHVCRPAGRECTRDLQCATTDFCDACLGACRARAPQCGRCDEDNGCDPRSTCHPVGPEGLGHCLRRCQGSCDVLGPGYECADIGGGTTACVPQSRQCDAVVECEGDADCPAGRFCNDRQVCQPGCTDDRECANGLICQGLRCAMPCAGDGDCPGGAVCEKDGRCRVPGGCVTSADCPEPQTYCDRATNQCAPGCETDDDCFAADLACVGHGCVRRGCARSDQCGFGEVCNLATAECVMAEGRHCEAGCDPMDMMSCGGEGRMCLSFQDEDMMPLGDYCLEPCQMPPNECPQGFECIELMDQDGMPTGDRLCFRRCWLDPFR